MEEPKRRILNVTDIIQGETEFIPLLSEEDEETIMTEVVPEVLPILPLRNTVLFPGIVIPITVGRDKSIRLIKESYKVDRTIGVVAQRDAEIEEPVFSDLCQVGTLAHIIKLLQMPDGNTTAIIQGKKRIKLEEMVQEEPYFKARVAPYGTYEHPSGDKEMEALLASLKDLSIQIVKQSPNIPSEAGLAIRNINSPVFLVNFVSSNLSISVEEKQKLLEITDLREMANLVLAALVKELQMLELKAQIQSKVRTDIEKQQRDFLLHQQLKTIQEELGGNPVEQETKDLREKAKAKKWPEAVAETFEREVGKLQRMNPAAAEFSVQFNYLEFLVELPWNEFTEDCFDLDRAENILNEDHFGLEKVKERILEYLAVLKLKNDMKSPILCFVGPPGVGKTSLGKSIARALNRRYVRMSLGGIRDEAELRGHRKTYVGAMPGRIIQNLKKVKSSNPVFVLDEVDKVIGSTIHGDPQAALLEILDPEQNSTFYDNYLEVDYDLSKVMFIATANTLSTVNPALQDRMEVIDLSGYLLEEKVEIAKRHLLPKQYKEHGIRKGQLAFSDLVIRRIIEDYTREAGVRALEKNIAKLLRYHAKFIVGGKEYNRKIDRGTLQKILGPPRYQKDRDISNKVAGVVTGLAWTASGGEILFVEVSLSQGKGLLTLTGNLGDVMKESATIAFEYLKAHADHFRIEPAVFRGWNVHIHIPEGATPKDGPSAGITMFTALVSAFTQRKVKPGIAMTGEITLRGKILPVGGLKEKILAAKRAKIHTIILSKENIKDVEEISHDYVKGLDFVYLTEMTELEQAALLNEKVKHPLDLEILPDGSTGK
jgi:ATP-dependent Lon protease